MSYKVTRKYRKLTVYSLVFIFLGPIVAAHLLYAFKDQIDFKTIQKGQLCTPAIPANELPFFDSTFLGKWQLIYISETNCGHNCEVPVVLDRIHLALGKEKHRVEYRSVSREKAPLLLTERSIAVVDPKGWLIIYYPPTFPPPDIVKDIRRLLRVSHG